VQVVVVAVVVALAIITEEIIITTRITILPMLRRPLGTTSRRKTLLTKYE
jgi:hypothetical protein